MILQVAWVIRNRAPIAARAVTKQETRHLVQPHAAANAITPADRVAELRVGMPGPARERTRPKLRHRLDQFDS